MTDWPTLKHFKEYDSYRLILLDKIKSEVNLIQKGYFQYRLKIIDDLLRLKK